jgi:hypothetical protein
MIHARHRRVGLKSSPHALPTPLPEKLAMDPAGAPGFFESEFTQRCEFNRDGLSVVWRV